MRGACVTRDPPSRIDPAADSRSASNAGTIPTINDGLSRLWHLDRFGPTPHAFTFKLRFPPPGVGAPPVDMQPDPWCVGNA